MYLHQEALGSVGLVTDNLGGELERTYFDPFGEKADVFGKATSPLLGDVKLGFTGHRHDDELALIDVITYGSPASPSAFVWTKVPLYPPRLFSNHTRTTSGESAAR